jgi:hypothetical protein
MTTISSTSALLSSRVEIKSASLNTQISLENKSVDAAYSVSSTRGEVNISSLAERLNRAESVSSAVNAKLSHKELAEKVQKNIERINYPLTPENKSRVAKEVPAPNDSASSTSAKAASDYVNNLSGLNPFCGLSPEQLATIQNDESGTFTTNEKYAAYRQAYDDEQKWRTRIVAKAMEEYHTTGKLTNFFESVLTHYNELPKSEQSLYPEDYELDLRKKIDLDFNYFTHMPNGLRGYAPGSLASLNKESESEISIILDFPKSSPGFPPSR